MRSKERKKAKLVHVKKRKVRSKSKFNPMIILLVLGVLLLATVITYLVWPFNYALTIINSKETPIISEITVLDSKGEVLFEGERHVLELRLWKGNYTVVLNSTGYEVEKFQVVNKIGFKINQDINATKMLTYRIISFTEFSFFDPTTALEMGPKIKIIGKNILGDYVDEEQLSNGSLIYGDYILYVYNNFFETQILMKGDELVQNGNESKKIVLQPNDKFMLISEREAENTMNFLADFILLSQKKLLDDADLGFPKQFYIYGTDTVISLGKMLFLFCEKQAYQENGIDTDFYFLPKNQNYWTIESVNNVTKCYEKSLIGAVPKNIGKNHLHKELARTLLGEKGAINYKLSELNTEVRGIDVAFTFDIESGRYVFDSSGIAISPCKSGNYSQGLLDSELVCNKPEFVGWMTPLNESVLFTNYAYPHVSGLVGYERILEYPGRYGIPITNYYVKKDLLAYAELSPELDKKSRKLVDKNLIEVGSHTRYHTHVNLVDESTALREMNLSREFLNEYFNTTVVGFRAPYNVMLGDELQHAKALEITGYEYFSQFGQFKGVVNGTSIKHKQWNSDWKYMSDIKHSEMRKMLKTKPYIITLDHPWNMAYDEGVYLVENPLLLNKHRANVLTIISNGGIIVKARDLDLNLDE
ncbi:polysaccharide deacetylase family protein [Candidatus Woesearchaeota archaeon]|nr:polysaccharide deacetylase family protein [Candidatus Woesearchaeota archaeon]